MFLRRIQSLRQIEAQLKLISVSILLFPYRIPYHISIGTDGNVVHKGRPVERYGWMDERDFITFLSNKVLYLKIKFFYVTYGWL